MNCQKALLVIALTCGSTLGCGPAPESARGFRLPDGNAAVGAATFIAYQCHACHEVEGEDLPKIEPEIGMRVTLGGEVARVVTYGELVSSVINPSHRIAQGYWEGYVAKADGTSKMENYNDILTVQELIDLVAYLQGSYDVVVPEYVYRAYPM